MDKSRRSRIMTSIFFVLVVMLVWFLSTSSSQITEKPTASNYYHGAFRNKMNPNIWGDDNGKQVPAPPDAIPYHPESAGVEPGRSMAPAGGFRITE